MIITIPEIEKQFEKWNGIIFNNELPKPHFELMQTRRLLGQFCPRKIFGEYTYKIRISTFYDCPLERYIDTIVHEMLHYYIKYKGIKDTSSHGRVWKQMAYDISKKYGLTITRTNPAGGGVSEAVIEKKMNKDKTFEYVFLCKMTNGRYGAGVVPSTKIHIFKPRFSNWNHVKSYIIVKAPWNQTYRLRHLRTVCGVGYITDKMYKELSLNKKIS
jgi:hypothetical protein